MPDRRGTRGTSLLDYVTALGLFGLLAGIAAPNLRAWSAPWTLGGAARQVALDVHLVRQRAIATNARQRITFERPRSYVIERESSPGAFARTQTRTLPRTVRLGRVRPVSVLFDTRGMVAAPIRVPLQVDGARQRQVAVNVLGQATIR